jgi:4-amino-4-deoxy-L-arabinose transferase-like glycosyltransferase
MLWGGWLIVTVVVISLAKGIIHPYYSVAVAPAIGAMVGIGASALWERRANLGARIGLALALAATAVWAYILLDRAPQWMPWLRVAVLAAGGAAAVLLVLAPRLRGRGAFALALLGITAALAGPTAYAIDTTAASHAGAIPSAGPSSGTGPNGLLGGPAGAFRGRPGAAAGGFRPGTLGTGNGPPLPPGFGTGGSLPRRGLGGGAGTGSFPPGGFGGPSGTRAARGAGGFLAGRGGGPGGFLSISTPGSKLVKALEANAANYTWVAATVDSNSAAGYQLATGDPVMAIGGFNGTDPAPTLAQFQRDVADRKIHFFISGGFGPGNGSTGTTAGKITQWVESHFTAKTLNGVTVYDLSSAS